MYAFGDKFASEYEFILPYALGRYPEMRNTCIRKLRWNEFQVGMIIFELLIGSDLVL